MNSTSDATSFISHVKVQKILSDISLSTIKGAKHHNKLIYKVLKGMSEAH